MRDRETVGETVAQFQQFSATLLPHRSLSRKGFIALIFSICGMSLISGIVLVLLGAWPVTGFFGLDALLLYLAFRLNYRAGRLSERLVLAKHELRVTRRHPSGKNECWSFNPYWVSFHHTRRENGSDELSLSSHGRKLIFGAFLSDGEKESFAAALNAALARHKY